VVVLDAASLLEHLSSDAGDPEEPLRVEGLDDVG
jgi:hypothetical protein